MRLTDKKSEKETGVDERIQVFTMNAKTTKLISGGGEISTDV